MEEKRILQTRMKLTWFGAINSAICMYLGFIFQMPDVVYTGLGLMGLMVGGYQASEGWTKNTYLKQLPKIKPQEESEIKDERF